MKVTAETLTDTQIRTLTRADAVDEDIGDYANIAELASSALGAPFGSLRRVKARARCAEILNAKAAR